jgi:hypothetical protein
MVAARWLVVGAVSGSLLIAGCGSATKPAKPQVPRSAAGTITIPAPPPTGVAADPAAVSVIRAWADALRAGHVLDAARYFAVPSEMINGVGANGAVSVIRIRTAGQAAVANATLPCGARLISADMRGRYVNALFRLTGRPGPGGSSCGSGAGVTARTNFVISGGRIVEWIRAPDDPGDNGGPPVPALPAPSSPTTPGPSPIA